MALNTPARFAQALNFAKLFRTPLSNRDPALFGHQLGWMSLVDRVYALIPTYGAPFLTLYSEMISTVSRRSEIIESISRRAEIDESA